MNFIVDLFTGNGIATALIYICITAFVGVLLGKLEFKKVKLGIAGVLFTGIILAHFGARVNADMLHFAQEFGLIIFVYAIGIEVGPRFFGTFRSDGLLLNVFAVSIVAMGFGIALAFHYALDLEPGVITGIFCGAVTNTPALGAAKQVISDYNASNPGGAIDGEILGMGYAVAYPLGVIGIIASMIILKAIFRVKIDKEVDEYTHSVKTGSSHLESVVIKITNSNLYDMSIEYVSNFVDSELVISRVERGGEFLVPTAQFVLHEGDIIHGVSAKENIDNLRMKLGSVELGEKVAVEGTLTMKRFMVTNRKIAGKTIEQLGIYRRYPANITRIYRAGMEILPTRNTTIEVGDAVREKRIADAKEVGGYSAWSHCWCDTVLYTRLACSGEIGIGRWSACCGYYLRLERSSGLDEFLYEFGSKHVA